VVEGVAVKGGDHLLRCIVYIDMNMVRAGVVEHPDQWTHGGYREVQSPRRKCILIDYDRLKTLCGFDDFKSFQVAHRRWVKTAIVKNVRHRESAWTRAVAVGSQSFVAKIKNQLNALAIGRRVLPATDFWELREDAIPYNPFIGGPEVEIGTDNTYLWNESDGREYF